MKSLVKILIKKKKQKKIKKKIVNSVFKLKVLK